MQDIVKIIKLYQRITPTSTLQPWTAINKSTLMTVVQKSCTQESTQSLSQGSKGTIIFFKTDNINFSSHANPGHRQSSSEMVFFSASFCCKTLCIMKHCNFSVTLYPQMSVFGTVNYLTLGHKSSEQVFNCNCLCVIICGSSDGHLNRFVRQSKAQALTIFSGQPSGFHGRQVTCEEKFLNSTSHPTACNMMSC